MKPTRCPLDKIIQIFAEAELPGSFIAKVYKKIQLLQEVVLKDGHKNIKSFFLLKLKNLRFKRPLA